MSLHFPPRAGAGGAMGQRTQAVRACRKHGALPGTEANNNDIAFIKGPVRPTPLSYIASFGLHPKMVGRPRTQKVNSLSWLYRFHKWHCRAPLDSKTCYPPLLQRNSHLGQSSPCPGPTGLGPSGLPETPSLIRGLRRTFLEGTAAIWG